MLRNIGIPPPNSIVRAMAVHTVPSFVVKVVECCPKHKSEFQNQCEYFDYFLTLSISRLIRGTYMYISSVDIYARHFIRGSSDSAVYYEDPVTKRLSLNYSIEALLKS